MLAERRFSKALLAGLFAGVLLLPAAASAQEIVNIGGTEATRVVIAPATTDIARRIKADLSDAYYNAPDTAAYAEAQKLYYFYGARGFAPLWIDDANGKAALSPAADKILKVFGDAELEGLRPADYLTPALDVDAATDDPARTAALEVAFTAATMRYAQNVYGGRVDPRSVSPNIDIRPRLLDQTRLLTELAASDDPAAVLAGLDPKHREFVALKAALARFYEDGAETDEKIQIPAGKTLRLGMVDDRVPLLRKRLDVPAGADGNDAIYDEDVAAAVKAFQEHLGLEVDGIAGPATVAALNGGPAVSKEDIVANMERWRWMPEDLGDFNVMVNIPEFRLAVMQGDTPTYTTRVVVGKPTTQTPIFSDNIRQIVVNPYWNVPPSIASNEIRPHLAANPGYLDGQNMELLFGGRVVNAAMFDWATTSMDNFRVRQRPGAANALGKIKFLFPNSHDVYLHDTPSKSLFARSIRAYSHGCVRVQNPMDFADALLVNEPSHLDSAKLESMYGPSERWVSMEAHVPIHITYFTLRVDQDGTIRSYADIYGHNKKLIEMLDS